MKKMCLFFIFAFLLGVIEMLFFYPQLPDYMAVHFNLAGSADRWDSKSDFFWTMETVFALLVALFGTLPLIIRRLPVSYINIPNREFWFAPERKEQTTNRLVDQLLFIGAMALLLMDGVLYLSMRANLVDRPALPSELLWGMIIVFFVVNIVWTMSLIRSFRQPPH